MISNTTPYQAAESYLERGWFPIDVEYKTKNPEGEHWQNRRISKENIHTRFNKKEQNVRILLGISNGLIDVDLDCPEAVELAPFFLPPTHLKGGRGERPNSHWFYCCPNFKTMQFSHGKKEDDDGMIVEIRGITSSGTPQQTLVYPSVHPSGDKYIWNESGNPAPIEQEVLIKKVKQLAAASLLARHWPVLGARNNTAMALAGTLLRSEFKDQEWVVDFMEKVGKAGGGSPIPGCYKQIVEDTSRKLDEGQQVTGFPTLKRFIGSDAVADKFRDWMGLKNTGPSFSELVEQIDDLSEESIPSDIQNIIDQMVSTQLTPIEEEDLLQRIKRATKRSIKALRDSLRETSNSCDQSGDIGMDIAEQTLVQHFAGGEHLIRAADKSFWKYTGTHWERATDEQVKKLILELVQQNVDPSLISYSHAADQALSLLKAKQAKEGDPLRFTKEPKPIINVINGELSVDGNGNVELREHRADSFLTYCLDVKYDPDATCPIYDEALLGIFSNAKSDSEESRAIPVEMSRHWNEFMGYAIQPHRDIPSFWLLRGGGDNGKTMLIKVLIELMGSSSVYSGRINELERNPYGTGELAGKLIFYDDDVRTGTRLPDGILKQMSESKLMSGQLKFINSFEFVCVALPVLLCNNFPSVADLSYGFRRRAHVIPFDRIFRNGVDKDPTLFSRIKKDEMSGILNRSLEGLKRVRERGEFLEPSPCLREKYIFLAHANPLENFIQTECWQNKEDKTCKQDIKGFFEAFETWCNDNRIKKYPTRILVSRAVSHLV
ncbi:MAG: bifunctional DNA primase/polymerase [Nitrospinae bacterium]|nr:bifunctional DNA primase/polymerase [Nitrospinota bacterium]